MKYNYNKLFWGIIFLIININIGFIDIFANFVGYFMIADVFFDISKEEKISKMPLYFAFILGIVDIIKIFGNSGMTNTTMTISSLSLDIIFSFMTLVIYYYICKIIIGKAKEKQDDYLANFGYKTWYIIFSYNIFYMIFTPFFLNLGSAFNILVIVLVILGTVAIIRLLMLVRKAHNRL